MKREVRCSAFLTSFATREPEPGKERKNRWMAERERKREGKKSLNFVRETARLYGTFL